VAALSLSEPVTLHWCRWFAQSIHYALDVYLPCWNISGHCAPRNI